ncbi:MAG: hypothetical protein PHW96_03760 [Candidatus Nanoarchaeia archaeon]|nr:hypothetical protein [Candidatus Nanoarchaeia archaeon]
MNNECVYGHIPEDSIIYAFMDEADTGRYVPVQFKENMDFCNVYVEKHLFHKKPNRDIALAILDRVNSGKHKKVFSLERLVQELNKVERLNK